MDILSGKTSKTLRLGVILDQQVEDGLIHKWSGCLKLGEMLSAEANKVMSNARVFVGEIKALVYAASGSEYIEMR